MRTIVHLSDLHFGRADLGLLEPLRNAIYAAQPDLVVVSGDLTQRARKRQFQQAGEFLESLPQPQVVVPGNHDIPVHNVYARLFRPLHRYRKHIHPELLPSYVDDEMAVFGLNSTRSLTVKHGRLHQRDIFQVRRKLEDVGEKRTRFVVCHHPFDLPSRFADDSDLIRGSHDAVRMFAEARVDVVLAGHLHLSHTSHTAQRYKIPGYSAILVLAGTAISTRCRGELNSFNVLHSTRNQVAVQRFAWAVEGGAYVKAEEQRFRRTEEGWRPMTAPEEESQWERTG